MVTTRILLGLIRKKKEVQPVNCGCFKDKLVSFMLDMFLHFKKHLLLYKGLFRSDKAFFKPG